MRFGKLYVRLHARSHTRLLATSHDYKSCNHGVTFNYLFEAIELLAALLYFNFY